MKKTQSSFSQIRKRIARTRHGFGDAKLMHPVREWFIGLLVVLLFFVVVTGWSITTYVSYSNLSPQRVVAENDGVEVYKTSLVQSVLDAISVRAVRHGELLDQSVVKQTVFVPTAVATSTNTATDTPAVLDTEAVFEGLASTTEQVEVVW